MGRRTLVLVVALLLAAIATFAVYNFLSGVEEEAAKDRVRLKASRKVPKVRPSSSSSVMKRAKKKLASCRITSSTRLRNCKRR
jgi:hypothetical protein